MPYILSGRAMASRGGGRSCPCSVVELYQRYDDDPSWRDKVLGVRFFRVQRCA
jgi:hypothetical protein